MDLHLTADQPTNAEQAAVDGALGPPKSGWEGGQRVEVEGRVIFGPAFRRDLLLPVLHAIQSRAGWISPGAVNYVALRLNLPPAEIHGVASFYAMFSLSSARADCRARLRRCRLLGPRCRGALRGTGEKPWTSRIF